MHLHTLFFGSVLALTIGAVCSTESFGQGNPTRAADPFARYETPAECALARARLERQYWRDRRPDTVFAGPYGRVPAVSTIDSVRQCVSRFHVDSVLERDLLGLGHAYLAADQEPLAEAAFQRLLRLSSKRPSDKQAWVLAQIVDLYASVTPTTPARIARAQYYVALLDKLGDRATVERTLAYLDIADIARRADSVDLVDTAARAALAIGHTMIDTVRKQRAGTLSDAYEGMAYLHMRRYRDSVAVAVLEEGVTTINQLRKDWGGKLERALLQYRLLGHQAPRVQATRWFNEGRGHMFPALNTTTLITFATHNCAGIICYPGYGVVRRFHALAGGQRPNWVFAVRTEGYIDRYEVVAPDKELEWINSHFVQDLQLPMTVAAWQTTFGRRADGLLQVVKAPNDDAYHPDPNGPALQTFITDKQGIVRFITALHPYYEAELKNVVAELE